MSGFCATIDIDEVFAIPADALRSDKSRQFQSSLMEKYGLDQDATYRITAEVSADADRDGVIDEMIYDSLSFEKEDGNRIFIHDDDVHDLLAYFTTENMPKGWDLDYQIEKSASERAWD